MRLKRRALGIGAAFAIVVSTLMAASPATGDDEFDPYAIVVSQGLLEGEGTQAEVDQRIAATLRDATPTDQIGEDTNSAINVDGGGAVEAVSVRPSTSDQLTVSSERYAEVAEAPNYGFVTGKNDQGANASFVVIGDASAPTEYTFQIGDGTHVLTPNADGTITVSNPDGEFVNYILPAWATDASGKSLNTGYQVNGTTITQTVDTAGADFPIVADPSVGCGVPWCSIYFSRNETHSIGFDNDITAGTLVAGCGLVNLWVGAACAVSAVWYVQSAKAYWNNGNCLGVFVAFIPVGPGFAGHNPFEEPRSSNRC